jgi:predicted house-cleaning noncanonical NTP pyrophosphatase (MazG superfamily)
VKYVKLSNEAQDNMHPYQNNKIQIFDDKNFESDDFGEELLDKVNEEIDFFDHDRNSDKNSSSSGYKER